MLGAAVLAAVLSAAAAPPVPLSSPIAPQCADGGRRQRAHETGRIQGEAYVETAWDSLDRDCRALAALDEVVRAEIARQSPPGGSEVLICRHTGFKTGAGDALAAISAVCAGKELSSGGGR
jgi:hypothetical protein